VRHTTTYRYASPVDLGSHMLHLRPRELAHQHVLHSRIIADPQPSRWTDGVDHFGNGVSWLFMDLPHTHFDVMLEAEVEVAFPQAPDPMATPAWEAVAADPGWQAMEFLFDSAFAPAHKEAGAYMQVSFPPGRPVLAGLIDLLARFAADFRFRAGVTTISTPVSTVLSTRAGVCQDFAHLMIAGLRAIGLPARYVSGYIRTKPPPGQQRRRGADQSHAWVGVWLGREHGWIDIDPTNNLIVADEHVVLAWGRDYRDISPVRGVILGGGGKHGLTVSVDLEAAEEAVAG
jgi:transglutaminase-like putative cysteine protease